MQTIMVVDDDTNIRAVLKYGFEKESYGVHVATRGWRCWYQKVLDSPILLLWT